MHADARRAESPDTEYSCRLPAGQSTATPCYPQGCAAGPQEREVTGGAWSASAAWIVNFNNGNANNNDRNNHACVRAVRVAAPSASGECHGAGGGEPSLFQQLHAAWSRARASKRPSHNQLQFDARWIDGLLRLEREIQQERWEPRRPTCFVATRPKAREIHAPDFADRVVHHWLVPQLERIYEPRFIHDSYANRCGKGTHAAVRRLQAFVRQVHSGTGGGWYLQLDVHNFFNQVHRPTLWRMLRRRMRMHQVPEQTRRVAHALLRRPPLARGVDYRCTPREHALVPTHKQLRNAPADRGLPIGNLSSQFFANVYLDALDQFCKHQLKARRYLRYVDDFVLVADTREQLEAWLPCIEAFLHDELRLRLKPDIRLRPLATGIDFLGYVVRPTHTRVRRRVVAHARQALASWETAHVRAGAIHCTPVQLQQVQATWASYLGHFEHAATFRLEAAIRRRFGWLRSVEVRRRFCPERMTLEFTARYHRER